MHRQTLSGKPHSLHDPAGVHCVMVDLLNHLTGQVSGGDVVGTLKVPLACGGEVGVDVRVSAGIAKVVAVRSVLGFYVEYGYFSSRWQSEVQRRAGFPVFRFPALKNHVAGRGAPIGPREKGGEPFRRQKSPFWIESESAFVGNFACFSVSRCA